MSARATRSGLALVLGATALLTAAGFVLMAANWPHSMTYAEWGFPGFQGSAAIVFAAVGAPVALRRPANPIGWLLLVAGLLSALQHVGHQYAIFGLLTAPGSVPEPWIGTWIEEWIWIPIMATMGVFPFFLFPTGRFLSPRWRAAGILALVAVLVGSVASMFAPLSRVPGAESPLARLAPVAATELLITFSLVFLMPTLFISWASVVVRFRRAAGVERQQLKWLALGGLVVAAGMTIYLLYVSITLDAYGVASALIALALFAVPVTMAVAMLRHGLYEIDRLLNRTIVYGLVSTVLAGVYLASVIVLQALLDPITSGENVAVAASTLVVASAFHPVRRRVQGAIDRRFFRSRYDAQATVERFGLRLRDEIDPRSIATELVAEATRAIQPAGAVLWLRRR